MYSAFQGKQLFEQHAVSRVTVLKMLGMPSDRKDLGWLEGPCIAFRDWLLSKGLGGSSFDFDQFFIKSQKSNGDVGQVKYNIPNVTKEDQILDFKALMLAQIFGQVESGHNLLNDNLWYGAVKNFEVKR